MNYTKKAAMFGLDARIALAIFGALSVVSGAALYSAIQEAKVTQTITDMQELIKAVEAYYLDVGSPLNLISKPGSVARAANLAEDPGLKGWKGPYHPATAHGGIGLKHPNTNDYHIIYAREDLDWDSPDTVDYCTDANICYLWARIYDHADLYSNSIKQAIDAKIDNSDGAEKGKFRWNSNAINLRGFIIPNPN